MIAALGSIAVWPFSFISTAPEGDPYFPSQRGRQPVLLECNAGELGA